MKITEMTPAQLERHRANKREASRRCRARKKLIASGQLLTSELAIRKKQPQALVVENFKIDTGSMTLRLNRNGGEKVALVVSKDGERTRKGFQSISAAVDKFNELLAGV